MSVWVEAKSIHSLNYTELPNVPWLWNPPAIPDTLSKNTICILENDSTWRGTFGHRKVRDIPTPTTGMVNRRGGYWGDCDLCSKSVGTWRA